MRRPALPLVACVLVGLLTTAACGQRFDPTDRVLFQSPSGSVRWVGCQIHEYDSRRIRFQVTEDGDIATADSETVVEVRTPQVASHSRGQLLLELGKPDEAKPLLRSAIALETRPWVRREILSLLVRVAYAENDYSEAVRRYLALYESDPGSPHVALSPVAWMPLPLGVSLRSEARGWMTRRTGRSEMANLIGASLLLTDPDQQADAERTLKRLRVSGNRTIQRLAALQQLRPTLGSETEIELSRVRDQIAALPEEFRSGPRLMFGEMLSLKQDYDRAVAEWMWVPTTNAAHFWYASEALSKAAAALRIAGDERSALTLRRELLLRFPTSDAARSAKSLVIGEGAESDSAGRPRILTDPTAP